MDCTVKSGDRPEVPSPDFEKREPVQSSLLYSDQTNPRLGKLEEDCKAKPTKQATKNIKKNGILLVEFG